MLEKCTISYDQSHFDNKKFGLPGNNYESEDWMLRQRLRMAKQI